MKPNRLIEESSPYLKQHAYNPVEWLPWSDRAFEEAARAGKPVLVSIGYSSCHWCHVMERESFADKKTARVMNENFVCLKVDMEERPDIDALYQRLGRVLGGGGGWPLTVFMTPEKLPFFIGTYFPPAGMPGAPGFRDVCRRLAGFYRENMQKAEETGRAALGALRAGDSPGENVPPGMDFQVPGEFERAVRSIMEIYDPEYGGFGPAQKFPCVPALELLLCAGGGAREATFFTLSKMAFGGIYDHAGGGFHRYAVDREWALPHFEKMLYDNALLAGIYADAFRISGEPVFKSRAEETLSFLISEMSAPGGGFYSSLDADSPGGEGAFYTWTRPELNSVLGKEEGILAADYYGVSEEPSVLRAGEEPSAFARKRGLDVSEFEKRLSVARGLLAEARREREKPFRDEKIITAWNGMMISALARAGGAFGRVEYIEAAEKTAEFIQSRLVGGEGRLARFYLDGPSGVPGFLGDYAWLAAGLIDLSGAALDKKYFERAAGIADTAVRLFYEDGVFRESAEDIEAGAVYRVSSSEDGAVHSGAAVLLETLLKLEASVEAGGGIVKRFFEKNLGEMKENPFGHAGLFSALRLYSAGIMRVELDDRLEPEELEAMRREVFARYLPGLVLLAGRTGERPGASACRNFKCLPPVYSPDELGAILDSG